MNTAKLNDGTQVFCIQRPEALVLDSHVEGYLTHGITINKGDIIFDVGANIGVFGVRSIQKYDDTKVYAFEPIPDIYEVLQANADKFGPERLIPLPYGVSTEKGEATFDYYPNSPALSTSNSHVWDEDPEHFARAVEGNLKNMPKKMWWAKYIPASLSKYIAGYLRSGKKSVHCRLMPISDIIDEYKVPKIDLLKIDCEGAELEALQGIRDEHWPIVHKVVLEVHDMDNRVQVIKDILTKHGFENIVTEKEKGLEKTDLYNLYAVR